MPGSLEDVLAAIASGVAEIKQMAEEQSMGFERPQLIHRISAFSQEDAQKMVFYTKEQWDKMPEEKRTEYEAQKAERDAIIAREHVTQQLVGAVTRMTGEKAQ